LAEAIDMAGARPRELLNLPPRRLTAGDPADLVLLDKAGDGVRVQRVVAPSGVFAATSA
jgi:N-acetylglucosamine-6-phosphate deacetylase